MKEEGVKKVNMSILETEIDLITSIKNDFAIFENSSDLPVLDYPSRLEMGMMAICLRGTTPGSDPVLPAVPADPVADQRRSPDSAETRRGGFRSGILFFLAPESQHARQLFPSRDRQEPVPCSFLRIGQYHEPSCSRRRTAGENASGRSVRTVHSSGPGSL